MGRDTLDLLPSQWHWFPAVNPLHPFSVSLHFTRSHPFRARRVRIIWNRIITPEWTPNTNQAAKDK